MLLNVDTLNNSFVVLMVCMSYIEGVEQYKTGVDSNRQSKEYFINSVNRIYPDRFCERHVANLYSKSRCGLFHNGMVKGGVVFNNSYTEVIEFQDNGQTININPTLLLKDIKKDFSSYIAELKSSDTNNHSSIVRKNFNRMFSVL